MSTNELLYMTMVLSESKSLRMPIVEAVCHVTKCAERGLMSRSRLRPVTEARQVAMFFLLASGESTANAAGTFHRDHSTAVHSRAKIKSLYGQKSERKLTELVGKVSDLTGIPVTF